MQSVACCQCSMVARAVIALVALAALRVRAQDASIFIEVPPSTDDPDFEEEVEKRYTPELVEELESTKTDALLLYTEFSARASQSMKQFIRNISSFEEYALKEMKPALLDRAPEHCRSKFENRLKKIRYDANRAATFSGDTHHKFFLGHMIVFRMHLNKSEDYVRKCDKVIKTCGIACETTSKIRRWRRLAAEEINRVRDDILHSRKMYKDLLIHAQRRLNTLRRRAAVEVNQAVRVLEICVKEG